MILLKCLPEPFILAKNRERWLQAYLEKVKVDPQSRPHPSQYGHLEIRNTLRSSSFHKCFYCERKLNEREDEVEHYIEVSEQPELAFNWNNLYLSCRECNKGKKPNKVIPVGECLDPCQALDEPADHLTFDAEFIRPKAASQQGARTIQKYGLDRESLNYLRLKQLQHFEKFLRKLQTQRIHAQGRPLTALEGEKIASFAQPHHPFSLMFRVYLNLELASLEP